MYSWKNVFNNGKETLVANEIFEYKYDSNDNVIKEESYNREGILLGTRSFEYDDKLNKFSNINMPKWYFIRFMISESQFHTGKNNPVKETKDYNGITEKVFEYEYDEDGYPTSLTKDGKKYENIYVYEELK